MLALSAITLSRSGVSITHGEAPEIKAHKETRIETQTQAQVDEKENAATSMFLLADAYEKRKMKEETNLPQWLRFRR